MPRLRLGRGFSPSRWLRRADGLEQVAEGGNGQEWIVARGLCAYTTIDGTAVPARKRRGFAEMAVARWAPFPDPQSFVEWSGDRAMVWAWSTGQVLASPSGGPRTPLPRRIAPESLYRGTPQQEGEQLVTMDQGYEGRVWQAGFMVAGRWWAEAPSLESWNQFRRGVGLRAVAALPDMALPPLSETPWTSARLRGIGATVSDQRRVLSAIMLGLFSAFLFALLTAALSLKISIWQVEQDIQQREQSLEKIIAARDAALADQAAIAARLADRPAGQTQLLAKVSRLMTGPWSLQEWRMPDSQHLELVAVMTSPDPRAIVAAWEADPRFADVTAEMGRGPGEVRVKARIVPAAGSGAP